MGEPIHSGHFMKSQVHGGERLDHYSSSEDDDVEVDVLSSEAASAVPSAPCIAGRKGSAGAQQQHQQQQCQPAGGAPSAVAATASGGDGGAAQSSMPAAVTQSCYTAQQSAYIASLEKPVTFYKFGKSTAKSIAIDVSLGQLKKCIRTAYSRLTTPKWKDFKGVRLNWKQRIRLNNVIWRAWYMEFGVGGTKGRARFCYFSIPDTEAHCKIEGSVVEGMYWKRRFEIVCAQYRHWRANRCHRHKMRHKSSGIGSSLQSSSGNRLAPPTFGQLDWFQRHRGSLDDGRPKCGNTGDHGHFVLPANAAAGEHADDACGRPGAPSEAACCTMAAAAAGVGPRSLTPQFSLAGLEHDDLANDFTDRLFDSLLQPYMFPDAREFSHGVGGNADCIQPGLSALQPSLEEIISGFDDDTSGECCAAATAENACSPRTPPTSGLARQHTGTVQSGGKTLAPPAASKEARRQPAEQRPMATSVAAAAAVPHITVSADADAQYGGGGDTEQRRRSLDARPPTPLMASVTGGGGPACYSEREYDAAAMLARLQKRQSTAAAMSQPVHNAPEMSTPVYVPPPLYSQARYSHDLFAQQQAVTPLSLTPNSVDNNAANSPAAAVGHQRMAAVMHGGGVEPPASFGVVPQTHADAQPPNVVPPSSCNLLGTIASIQSSPSNVAAAHLHALLSPQSAAVPTSTGLGVPGPFSPWPPRVSIVALQQQHQQQLQSQAAAHNAVNMGVVHGGQHQQLLCSLMQHRQTAGVNPLPDLPVSPVAAMAPQLRPKRTAQEPPASSLDSAKRRRTRVKNIEQCLAEPAMGTALTGAASAFASKRLSSAPTPTVRVLAPRRAPADSSSSHGGGTGVSLAAADVKPAATVGRPSWPHTFAARSGDNGQQTSSRSSIAHRQPAPASPSADIAPLLPPVGGDRRRAAHVHAEASRREALKDGFVRLTQLLPDMQQEGKAVGAKVTNAVVLANTADYIRNMVAASDADVEREAELRRTIEQLNHRVAAAQSSLPASGCGAALSAAASDGGNDSAAAVADNARTMIRAHCRRRAGDNHKYWLLCQLFEPLMADFVGDVVLPAAGHSVQYGVAAAERWAERRCTAAEMRPVASRLLVRLATECDMLKRADCLPDYIKEQLEKHT